MIRITAILIIMFVSANAKASEEKLTGLDSLTWQYRVILVFAREPLASKALSNLHDFAEEIDERDIAWFVIDADAMHSNYDGEIAESLRQQIVDRYFTPLPGESAVLLIGKDGGVKSRSADLDLEATFGQIDRMPMRRAEIQRRQADQE